MTPKGLLVIDVQGKLARQVADSGAVIAVIAKTIQACRLLDIPVLWVEQNPRGLGNTVEELSTKLTHQTPLTKTTFDATATSKINNAIKQTGIKCWAICGIEAHVCVLQTALGLLKQGYAVELLTDAVSSRDRRNVDLAFTRLTHEGVVMSGFEMFVFEQLKDAASPRFKSVLPLLK